MRPGPFFRFATLAVLPLLLLPAACAQVDTAVETVGRGMARDWNRFKTNVLDQPAGESGGSESPSGAREPKIAKRPPAPPPERPALAATRAPEDGSAAETSSRLGGPIADLRRRAESGEPDAEYRLGLAYDQGRGIARDQREALHWYRMAGEHGHALGALNAGVLYDSGVGVPRDAVAAAFWYRKAADQGNARAAYNLAQLYENGDGVARDRAQAIDWYRRAQRNGLAAAGSKIAVLSPSPDRQIASRTPLPPETRPRAADSPPPDSHGGSLREALARDYAFGENAPDDQAVAQTIRAAADSGNEEALCNLGMRYVNGRGVPRDWQQAASLLRRAAQRDYAPAQTNLGMLLASEQNPAPDYGEALMWFSRAANAGYGPARAQLGMMYAAGRGVQQDSRMADFWLASARADLRRPAGTCAAPRQPHEAATAR